MGLSKGGHDQGVRVTLADLAFGIDLVGGEIAGAMEVDVGIEEVTAEAIHFAGEARVDVGIAELLANDTAVFAFHQGVVVAVARPRAGELDAQFVEQCGDIVIDLFAAAIGVKAFDHEGKAGE